MGISSEGVDKSMTTEVLKDLLLEAIGEYRYLAVRDLRWNPEKDCIELTTEDSERYLLRLERAQSTD